MKLKFRNSYVMLLLLVLTIISAGSYLSHSGNAAILPAPANASQEAKFNALTETYACYSNTSSPVNAPAPAVNNLTNGGPLTASSNPVSAIIFIHNSSSDAGLFTLSGNPIFPYAMNSPRLHLACMVFRI